MAKKINEEALLEQQEEISGFLLHLKGLEDPRIKRGRRHSLAEIFLLILCAQICGFETLREYELYGRLKLDFLRRFSPYPHGIPSRSTLARLLALFSPGKLEELLLRWVKQMAHANKQGQIAIDGKRHRGMLGKAENGGELLHLVHAYGVESGLVLGQEKVLDKSNEITAIPKYIQKFSLFSLNDKYNT